MIQSSPKSTSGSRWIVIFCLVFAGEMIFSLPFHVARFFRPTFLNVFNLSNAALGDILAVYGIAAMIVYFPGGALADRFSARKLITISLAATAFGGIYFAQIPGESGLFVLFGYWGLTTIFLFWGALIKATKEWGGSFAQGRAFGILDGGRGLIAAGAASIAVMLLSRFLPDNPDNSTVYQREEALQAVIWFYTTLTFLAAVLVWFFIPDAKPGQKNKSGRVLNGIRKVLRNRLVWLQALIVVCSYSGYKGLDYYSLYSVDVLGSNEVSAANFVANASYLRAVAAVIAGLLVDRFSATRVIRLTFLLLLISYVALSFLSPVYSPVHYIYGNILFTFAAVYALRGVYFALLEETNIQKILTGTAVGLISVIGYTPDVFFNSIAGRILDASPNLAGYQHFFMFLSGFALVGFFAALVLARENKQKAEIG